MGGLESARVIGLNLIHIVFHLRDKRYSANFQPHGGEQKDEKETGLPEE